MLFSDFCTQWREDVLLFGRCSTRDVRDSHMRTISQHFAGKSLEEVAAPGAVQGLVKALSTYMLEKSVDNVWGTLRAALNYAHRQGLIEKVPTREKTKTFKRPRKFLLMDQMNLLIQHSTAMERPFHALLCETGRRVGQALGLNASDIQGNVLTVNFSMGREGLQDPKTEASLRSITISVQLTRLLQPLIVPGAQIFQFGLTLSSKRLKAACERAAYHWPHPSKFPIVNHHALRHSHETAMCDLVVPSHGIMPENILDRRMGHVLQGMRRVYRHQTTLLDGPYVTALAEILYKGVKI